MATRNVPTNASGVDGCIEEPPTRTNGRSGFVLHVRFPSLQTRARRQPKSAGPRQAAPRSSSGLRAPRAPRRRTGDTPLRRARTELPRRQRLEQHRAREVADSGKQKAPPRRGFRQADNGTRTLDVPRVALSQFVSGGWIRGCLRRRRRRGWSGGRSLGRRGDRSSLGGGRRGGARVFGAMPSEEMDDEGPGGADANRVEKKPWPPAVSCEEHVDLRCWSQARLPGGQGFILYLPPLQGKCRPGTPPLHIRRSTGR